MREDPRAWVREIPSRMDEPERDPGCGETGGVEVDSLARLRWYDGGVCVDEAELAEARDAAESVGIESDQREFEKKNVRRGSAGNAKVAR